MFRRLLYACALALAFIVTPVVGFDAIAHAQEVPGDAPVVEVLETITLNATIVLLLVNFALPILNGIILRANPRPLVAQILSAATAAVTALVVQNQQTDGSAVFSTQTLLLWGVAFGTQIASYLGVWKPHDINGKTGPGILG